MRFVVLLIVLHEFSNELLCKELEYNKIRNIYKSINTSNSWKDKVVLVVDFFFFLANPNPEEVNLKYFIYYLFIIIYFYFSLLFVHQSKHLVDLVEHLGMQTAHKIIEIFIAKLDVHA